jgi:hypothetical protein
MRMVLLLLATEVCLYVTETDCIWATRCCKPQAEARQQADAQAAKERHTLAEQEVQAQIEALAKRNVPMLDSGQTRCAKEVSCVNNVTAILTVNKG